jgi:cardiolipin synthase
VGDAGAQVFTSSPSSGGDSMLLMYLLSITAAVYTTDLSASYFVPDDLTRQSLRAAGAEIHEFQPTMFHCKMLIVDQLMVSVGSTNFDNRSLRLNDEANLNVYDAEFAARASTVFEQDLKRARRITYEAWIALHTRPVNVSGLVRDDVQTRRSRLAHSDRSSPAGCVTARPKK